MNVVLWIVAGLLALAFLGSGIMKLSQPPAKLATMGLAWAGDFPASAVKTIGGLELLAAIGLILPAVLDIAPVFVPLAALGLVLVMIGAIVVHGRRGELKQSLPINLVFLVLAAVVVWGRFGPYAF